MSTTKKTTKHNARNNGATAPAQPDSSNADHPQSLELTASAEINVEASQAADADLESQSSQVTLPRFRMVAYTGGPMRISAWRYPVVVDLAGLSIPSQARPIRFGHDASAGIGHTDAIRIDENGQLVATGFISRDTGAAREVVVSSKNGFPWQASIGASVDEFEFLRENQKASVNGREYTGPLNIVRQSTLGEISFVDLGADGRTSVSVAATADDNRQEHIVMDDDNKVTSHEAQQQNGDLPDSNTTSSNQSAAASSSGTSQSVAGTDAASSATASSNGSANGNGQSVIADMRVQAAAEIDRIHAIRRICAGKHPTIESQAIRDGWDATRCELEVLRANRPKAPAVHVSDNSTNTQVLEAACLLTAVDSFQCTADVTAVTLISSPSFTKNVMLERDVASPMSGLPKHARPPRMRPFPHV